VGTLEAPRLFLPRFYRGGKFKIFIGGITLLLGGIHVPFTSNASVTGFSLLVAKSSVRSPPRRYRCSPGNFGGAAPICAPLSAQVPGAQPPASLLAGQNAVV
jgi:hypothetical protein